MIERPLDGGKSSDLVAQCAGNAIGHAAAFGVACDVDTMRIDTVVVFEIANQVAGELHIIGVAGWSTSTYTGIPGRRAINSLREDHDKACLVGFVAHACMLSRVLSRVIIAVIIYHYRLRLRTIGRREMHRKVRVNPAD